MKITDLTVTTFKWENIPTVRYGTHNPPTQSDGELGLLTVYTDEGLEGHAFLGSSFRSVYLDVTSLIRHLKPLLVGENPLDRERLNHGLHSRWRATTLRAIGAVDVALWDLCGKAANLPIHRLLGTYRHKIAAYASSSTLSDKTEYIEQALALREAGFRAYKVHPPTGRKECIEICAAVRDALGDDMTLMLDPAGIFDFPDAVRVGRALEELDYYWYEDPLRETDLYNYVKLRQKLDIPIMATEYSPGGFDAFAPWIMQQATDYLRADVAIKGGITAVTKAARLAEAFNMNIEVHHGGNSLNNVANLHVIMSTRNTEFFEVLLPDRAQKFGLVEEICVDKEGFVHTLDKPGLGAEIDFDLIERNKIEILK